MAHVSNIYPKVVTRKSPENLWTHIDIYNKRLAWRGMGRGDSSSYFGVCGSNLAPVTAVPLSFALFFPSLQTIYAIVPSNWPRPLPTILYQVIIGDHSTIRRYITYICIG